MVLPLPFRSATAVLAACVLLTSCAAESSASSSELSLAEAKSSVQLLRNVASERIPADLVDAVLVATDLSVSCSSETYDPEGLMRAWRSGYRVSLVPSAEPDEIIDALVASFTDQGWSIRSAAGASPIVLARDATFADFQISSTQEEGQSAELFLQLTGVCVKTDGADSAEVLELEALAY